MSAAEVQALWLSAQMAFWVLVWATPAAWLLATAMARPPWPGKTVVDTLILLPMVVSPAVLAFGLLMGLTPAGWFGRWVWEQWGWQLSYWPSGLTLACGVLSTSLMTRSLRPALEGLDHMPAAVARTLGATPGQAWRAGSWPQLAPAVGSAMALGWAAAWGETGASVALSVALDPSGSRAMTAPVALLKAQVADGHTEAASWLACISLGVTCLALYISERCRQRWQTTARPAMDTRHP